MEDFEINSDKSSFLRDIGEDWKFFMRLIGVPEETIETWCENIPGDKIEQSHQILNKHLQVCCKITWNEIRTALEILSRKDLIKKFEPTVEFHDSACSHERKRKADISSGQINCNDMNVKRRKRLEEQSKIEDRCQDTLLFAVIALRINCNWQSFCLQFNFDKNEIANIKENYNQTKEQAYQCLRKLNRERDEGLNLNTIKEAIRETIDDDDGEDIIERINNDLQILGQEILEEEKNSEQDVLYPGRVCWDFLVLCYFSNNKLKSWEKSVDIFNNNYKEFMEEYISIQRSDTVKPVRKQLSKFYKEDCVNYVKMYYGRKDFFTFNYELDNNKDSLKHFRDFLKNDDGCGFMIQNYNLMEHFKFFFDNSTKMKTFIKDKYFLNESSHTMDHIAAEEKNRTIFFVKISDAKTLEGLKNAINDSSTFIRMFIMLHKNNLIDGIACFYSLIVIPTESKHLIDEANDIYESIRNFVITKEMFSQFNQNELRKQFIKTIETDWSDETWGKKIGYEFSDLKYDLANVFGVMAASQGSGLIPCLTENVGKQIDNAKLLFHPIQLAIANSKDKRILLIGSYGSGKTIVARSRLKQLMSTPDPNVRSYYLNFGPSSDLTREMQAFVQSLDNNKSITCKSVDKLFKTVASIRNSHDVNMKIHLIFDEVSLHDFSEEEILKFIEILKEPMFADSHCVIACQSMSSVRSFTKDGINFSHSFTEQEKLLKEKSNFKMKKLDVNFRNTVNIANLAQHAIAYLENRCNIFSLAENQSTEQVVNEEEVVSPRKQVADDEALNQTSFSLENQLSNPDNDSLENSFEANDSEPALNVTNNKFQSKDQPTNLDLKLKLKFLKQNIVTDKDSKTSLENRFTYIPDSEEQMHQINGPYPSLFIRFIEKDSDVEKAFFVSLCFKNIFDDKVILCTEPVTTVIYFDEKIPKMLKTVKTFLTNYFKVKPDQIKFKSFLETQGCEYDNVIIYISTAEYYTRHYLVEAITRSKNNLIFIFVKEDGINSKPGDLWEMVEDWIERELVQCKNQKNLKYQKFRDDFEKYYKDQFYLETEEVPLEPEVYIDRYLMKSFDATIRRGLKYFHDKSEEFLRNNFSWKKIGRRAGLEEYFIKQIDEGYHGDYEKTFQCLYKINYMSKEELPDTFVEDIIMRFRHARGPPQYIFEAEFNHIDFIADSMVTFGVDWTKVGSAAGLEEYKVRTIDHDYHHEGEYEKCYQLLQTIQGCFAANACDLLFWKNLLEKVERGREVIAMLRGHPLFKEMNGVSNKRKDDTSSSDVLRMLVDEISEKILDWKSFGKVLRIPDTELKVIEKDYPKKEKRIFECMKGVHENKEVDVTKDWCFWKEHLLQFDNGKEIAVKLESSFPAIAENSKIKPECHNFLHRGSGFILHHYGLEKNRRVLDLATDRSIDVTHSKHQDKKIVVKAEDVIDRLKAMLNDIYSYGFNTAMLERAFDFGEVLTGSFDAVFNVLKSYFAKNKRDCGFVLKNYNAWEHYRWFGETVYQEHLNDNKLTAFFTKDRLFLHVFEANDKNIYKVLSSVIHEIQLFRSVNPFLEKRGLIHIGVILSEEEATIKQFCTSCHELGLITNIRNLQTLDSFEDWYKMLLRNSTMIQFKACLQEYVGSEYSPSVLANMLAENVAAYHTLSQCEMRYSLNKKLLKPYRY